MREAASDVLPFSLLGGFVIATRAMAVSGVSGVRWPSVPAWSDLTVEIVAQLIYTLLGVGLLILQLGARSGHDRLIYSILAGHRCWWPPSSPASSSRRGVAWRR